MKKQTIVHRIVQSTGRISFCNSLILGLIGIIGMIIINNNPKQNSRNFILFLFIGIIIGLDGVAIISNKKFSKQVALRIAEPINKLVAAANSIAKGNLEVDVSVNTNLIEVSVLSDSFKKIIDSLKLLKTDVTMLIGEALEGRLDTRADLGRHDGDYREIIDGVNKTLDSIILPVNEANVILGKMALNDYTAKMSENYKGKLKDLSDSINKVQSNMMMVQLIISRLSVGDTSLLDQFKSAGKLSENDKLSPAGIAMMQAIADLIDESNVLASAAVDGNLGVRGNTDKFEGGYKAIIEGMNKTMEAVEKPIAEISDVLQQMAKGNLEVSVTGQYKGEYAKITDATNSTLLSFNEVLRNINTASEQVLTGSKQVSDSSQSLSQGSTEQASAIEELSASITEIAAKTKQNAENATQANSMALEAKDAAGNGNNQMKLMIKSMAEINESSSNISKIIKTIDDIAFQTNMLALNAAVEAARAGQYGKGFAVVAEEVRNLATRSANAVKESTAFIEGTMKKVDDGAKITDECGRALAVIIERVDKAANTVNEIASASSEQATGISQINQGVQQVSKVVQMNSATSEETAASSEELSSQAQLLEEMISKFRLRKNENEADSDAAVMPNPSEASFEQAASTTYNAETV